MLGRSLRAEGVPLTIVGVAPPRFLGLGVTIENDITIPLTLFPGMLDSESTMVHGTSRWVSTTGRLAPRVPIPARQRVSQPRCGRLLPRGIGPREGRARSSGRSLQPVQARARYGPARSGWPGGHANRRGGRRDGSHPDLARVLRDPGHVDRPGARLHVRRQRAQPTRRDRQPSSRAPVVRRGPRPRRTRADLYQTGTQDLQVVGIVNDARLFDVRRGNLAIAYLPALQSGRLAHFKFLVVRAPASSARGIQQAIESLGAETMQRTQTLAYARGRTILQERMMAALGGYFGLLALMLVAAGVYGVLSYVLSLRRKEIGIRMALGADARLIGRTILGGGIRVAGAGLGVGLVAALLSVRVLQGVLVAASPYDPIAVASACGVLLVATVLASVAPAVRAARVEPLAELRRD